MKKTSFNRLYCHRCGKSVSTEFIPVATDTPDEGLIIRAWIECPECIEKVNIKSIEERLQIDPGGSDRIDELSDALMHLRKSLDEMEAELNISIKLLKQAYRLLRAGYELHEEGCSAIADDEDEHDFYDASRCTCIVKRIYDFLETRK